MLSTFRLTGTLLLLVSGLAACKPSRRDFWMLATPEPKDVTQSIQLMLQASPGHPAVYTQGRRAYLQIGTPDGQELLWDGSVELSDSGKVHLSQLPPDQYLFTFKVTSFLSRTSMADLRGCGETCTPIEIQLDVGGDLNGDDRVSAEEGTEDSPIDLSDLTVLQKGDCFDKVFGEPGYLPECDVNGDLVVSADDLAFVVANNFRQGEPLGGFQSGFWKTMFQPAGGRALSGKVVLSSD